MRIFANFFSFLVSVSSIKIFTAREQIEKVAHLNKNINDAQKLIKNSGLGLFKYGKIDIYKGNPTSLTMTEIAADPVSWVMCIALFYALFFTNTYVEFNGQDFEKVVHLGFVFLFQILLLSFAISGLGVFIYKKSNYI